MSDDDIELFGTDFDSGTIKAKDWLTLGALCETRRGKKLRWDAMVERFGHAELVTVGWQVATGPDRDREQKIVFDPARSQGLRRSHVGEPFPVMRLGREYDGKVIEVQSLIAVTVSYVTASNQRTGKRSRRVLYTPGELGVFAGPSDDGELVMMYLAKPWE